jgi:hypothetical protein
VLNQTFINGSYSLQNGIFDPMKKGIFNLTYFLVVLFVLLAQKAHSQYFLTGQDPGSIKWDQIKTDKFQIIYPQDYAEMAQYYINLLSLTSPEVSQPYINFDKVRRVSVILHNRTTTSNAMVGIAPIRADFFEMPAQNIYPQIWQDQLALHEYRHVVQMTTMYQGLTKGLYYVFGQQGVAAVMGLWLPFWFIEGDAVYTETMLSSSGRGRVPEFIYPLKAQVLDKKIYKYDKAVFGSYKNYVPDHYMLGYQLVSKGVQEYGMEMWKYTINRVARRPYYLVPFTTSIKQKTGKYKVQYYNQTLKLLRNEWWVTDDRTMDSEINTLSPETRFYTNYLFPNPLQDGSVVVDKTGLNDINRFVKLSPDGKETRLFTPGYDFQESLSVSGDVICWNEKAYDPRWDLHNYSVIKLYNFKTKELKKITKRSRYFAPALSNDGKKVVAVEVSQTAQYALHLLDAETGNILKEIKTDDNLFFITPHWSDNDQFIVAMVLGKEGKSLVKIDSETGEIDYLLPFSYKEIKWPVMRQNWVVFTGSYEGKDNLYALDVKTKKAYRIFDARFGATNVSFSKNGKELYFSNYTADGYKLASIEFRPESSEQVDFSLLHYDYLADKLEKPGHFNLDDTLVPDKAYPAKKYSKAANLFNIHSWAPLAVDAENYTANPGATILSQNVLSTSVASVTYLYDPNEQTSNIGFGFDYYSWYPVINFAVDYGGRRTPYDYNGETVELYWRETNVGVTFSVPLNFTSSKWVKGIRPSVGVDQKFLDMKGPNPELINFKENSLTVPLYRFYAYNQYKMSPKDLYPHWGQGIDILYRNTPFSDSVSSQFAATGWLYFPGFVKHQGFRIYGGYQKSISGNYSFSNFVAIPRGYQNVYLPEYFSIRSDYAFPIAYPDLDVPGLFYLKRIYSKVFYDYLQGPHQGSVIDLSSTGIELFTDWHFLSTLLNFNLGVRVSHRFYDDEQRAEFLFGVNVNY